MRLRQDVPIEWDHRASITYLEQLDQRPVREAFEVKSDKLISELDLEGLLPTPLVALAVIQYGMKVSIENLGYKDGQPLPHIGGYLRHDGRTGHIVVNSLLWTHGRRQVLAHECGHASLPAHIRVESMLQTGMALNAEELRRLVELEADLMGRELRFHGSMFRSVALTGPRCLGSPLSLAEGSKFAVYPDEAAERYVRDHRDPCALLEIGVASDGANLLIKSVTMSEPFLEHLDLRCVDLNGDRIRSMGPRPGGLASFARYVLDGAELVYRPGNVLHERVRISSDIGGTVDLTACGKALGMGRALIALWPTRYHPTSRPVPRFQFPSYEGARDLQDWLNHPDIGGDLLASFGEFQHPSLVRYR